MVPQHGSWDTEKYKMIEEATQLPGALQGLAEEIARSLVQEVESCRVVAKPASAGIVDLLLPQLAEEVVRQLGTVSRTTDSFTEDLEDRLLAVEIQLKKLALGVPDVVEDQDQDQDEDGSTLANLKYAKSKYKNVESLMNYIESGKGEDGIKLVIMNFND